MSQRKWVKSEESGLWSSYNPVIERQIERKKKREAEEKARREAQVATFSISWALAVL